MSNNGNNASAIEKRRQERLNEINRQIEQDKQKLLERKRERQRLSGTLPSPRTDDSKSTIKQNDKRSKPSNSPPPSSRQDNNIKSPRSRKRMKALFGKDDDAPSLSYRLSQQQAKEKSDPFAAHKSAGLSGWIPSTQQEGKGKLEKQKQSPSTTTVSSLPSVPRKKQTSSTITTKKPSKDPRNNPVKPSSLSGSSSKSRLLSNYDPNAMVKLNENPRDRRTIEEIERDMAHRKKNTAGATSNGSTAASTTTSLSSVSSSSKKQKQSNDLNKGKQAKRRLSEDDEEDDYDDDDEGKFVPGSIAQMMYEMRGKTGPRPQYYDDDDDDDDMEAGAYDVFDEEKQSARLARLEDKKEEAKEEARKREKLKRKGLA